MRAHLYLPSLSFFRYLAAPPFGLAIAIEPRPMDVATIGLTLVLFGLAFAFVQGCERW
jgi:hypothetical protein